MIHMTQINRGFQTIQGSDVVITVIDFVEQTRQNKLVWAKSAVVFVARVINEHQCIACVSSSLTRTSTEEMETVTETNANL